MLGKLMKYEIKSCGRIFFPFYIVALVFSIISALFINFDNFEHDFELLYLVVFLVIFALFIAAIVLTILLIVQRFNKSLLEDEGYLMFTLPVSEKTLVLSKFLTSLLFIILTSAVAMICMFLVLIMLGYTVSDVIDIAYFLNNLGSTLSENLVGILFYTLSYIVDYSIFILTIYLAITICHLPKLSKHKVLSGLGAIIVLMIIQSSIIGIADKFMTNTKIEAIEKFEIFYFDFDFGKFMDIILSVGSYEVGILIINILIAVALFFGTTTLLEKKLNLE